MILSVVCSHVAAGFDGDISLDRLYTVFDRESFEDNALPHLRNHDPNTAYKYDAAMAALGGVPPPSECSLAQRSLWGHLMNIIAMIFTNWRKANHPPLVQCEEQPEPNATNTSWSSKIRRAYMEGHLWVISLPSGKSS